MSLVFDKGKFKYYNDIEQLKPKYNNRNVNIGKNNQNKIISKTYQYIMKTNHDHLSEI